MSIRKYKFFLIERSYRMQNQKEISEITHFLALVSPVVLDVVRTIFQSFGWQVEEEGRGLELAFSIKSGEKELKFFVRNLLLEIATIDRDENPLRFDEELHDFDYFLAKTARLTQSKLQVLFHLLGEDDVDAAIENILGDAKQYERIRIWRFDQRDTDKKVR